MEYHHRGVVDRNFGYFSLRRVNREDPLNFNLKLGKYKYLIDGASIVPDSMYYNHEYVPIIRINEQVCEYLPHWATYDQVVKVVIWGYPYGVIEYTLVTGEKYRLVEYRHADGRVERFEE